MKLFHSSSLVGGGTREPLLPKIPAVPREEELQNSFHRHFSPIPGQWLSEEPIAFAGTDENLRPYARERRETL